MDETDRAEWLKIRQARWEDLSDEAPQGRLFIRAARLLLRNHVVQESALM